MSKATKRRWLVLACTAVVLAGGTGAWAVTHSTATAAAATTTLVAAATGTLQQTVSTTGTVQPAQQSAVAFTVPGTVTSVPVVVGQKIASGAVLATIDRTALQTSLTTAVAGVTAAEQQLASVASSSSVQVTAAQAQLAAAQSTLVLANANLTAGALTAPFTGVVAAVGIAVGDVVSPRSASGSSTGAGASGGTSSTSTGSITVITTDAWIVDAAVGSADLATLKKGLQATITPTGGTTVFGTIASLGIVASSASGGTATFPVVITVTGSPTGLYSGATATVSLIVRQLPNALTVPTSAIQTVNNVTVVYEHSGGTRAARPVTLGASYGPTTQILSGLKDGDQVEVPLGRTGGRGTRRSGTGTGGTPTNGGFGGGVG